MSKFVDISNKKFGKLTVQKRAGTKKGKAIWLCLCDCGNTTKARTCDLRNGNTRSCGCLKSIPWAKKHGMRNTPEYNIWTKMKSRCCNKNSTDYKDYGGRGIFICHSWLNSFKAFFADMGLRPSPKHSIDRVDNNGNYTPENCKWSTPLEQANNKRNNHTVKINGDIKTLSEWCRVYDIHLSTVRSRISYGWGEIKAITTPLLR